MSDDSQNSHFLLSSKKNARQMEKLNECLQDTNRNLMVLDKHLRQVKELGKDQATRVDLLREDLLMSSEQLREERKKASRQRGINDDVTEGSHVRHRRQTAPTKNFESRGAESDLEQGSRSRIRNHSVRFFDDMDAGKQFHSLHQSIRDLSSNQIQMQRDLEEERNRMKPVEMFERRFVRTPNDLTNLQVSESVAKRLEAIRNERNEDRLRPNRQEVSLSSELKQALDRLKKDDIRTTQVKDFQKQMRNVEEEKNLMRQQLEHVQRQLVDVKQNRTEQERRIKEQEEERIQLSRYASVVSDFNRLKQELDSSEKQKSQLSDHVEVLKKEIESKDKYNQKILQKLQETLEEEKERETSRQRSLVSSRDLQETLDEADRKLEKLAKESVDLRSQLQTSHEKNEELKNQAQQTVKLWKAKNQKLEKELNKLKEFNEELRSQNLKSTKETEELKTKQNSSSQSFENFKRDFNQLLLLRGELEEKIHLKDIQLNELISAKMNLTKDLMDGNSVIEKLETELRLSNEKMFRLNEAKNQIENQMNATQKSRLTSDNLLHQLQRELKDISIDRMHLLSEASRIKADNQELNLNLNELKKLYITAQDEMDGLKQKLKEETDGHSLKLETTQKEMSQLKDRESDKVKESKIRLKKLEAEYNAELQACKMELEEQKSLVSLQKKQLVKLQEEDKRLSELLARNEDEKAVIQHQLFKIRQQFLSTSYLTEEGLSNGRELEQLLLDAKENLSQQRKTCANVLQSVADEINFVIQAAVGGKDNPEKLQVLLAGNESSISDFQNFLIDIKNKLNFLRSQFYEMQSREAEMKRNIRDAVIDGEKDRQVLLGHIDRQNSQLDHLSVTFRPDTVGTQADDGSKKARNKTIGEFRETDQQPFFPLNLPKNFDQEREQIDRRYEKQQEAVNFLKQELSNLKLFPGGNKSQSDRPTHDLGPYDAGDNRYKMADDDYGGTIGSDNRRYRQIMS